MASITDELREWTRTHTVNCSDNRIALVVIADRIDEEHERELRETGEDIVRDVKREWVKLPVDADGEVWHVGDFVVGEVNPRNPKAIERMIWYGPDSGWQLETNTIIYPCPDRPRHHHRTPTVEDVLREFAHVGIRIGSKDGIKAGEFDFLPDEDAIAEFAKKLRLAGDE